ncbi:MAG: 7-cyano-7-deazaguanine synthase QueC [Deltaproteobacteria bacterium]|nr:7-cyano-7-deazaguanine synthase QueC [Deltaproteobacteria bacterium]
MPKSAVVLLSGGLDSTTCLAVALDRGFEVTALSFDYNQRHRVELEAARRVLEHYGVKRHFVFNVGLFREIGGSALTDPSLAVPQHRSAAEMGEGIPITYVPARNLVFLSYALGVAETVGAEDLFIGVNAVDYSGYPDCRPEFIRSFQETANLAVKAGVEGARFKVHAPLVELTKADIVELGTRLGVPYHLTHSCYAPTPAGLACGGCDSCVLRRKGFEEAGVPDPTRYAAVA